jgi:hypothetical protein
VLNLGSKIKIVYSYLIPSSFIHCVTFLDILRFYNLELLTCTNIKLEENHCRLLATLYSVKIVYTALHIRMSCYSYSIWRRAMSCLQWTHLTIIFGFHNSTICEDPIRTGRKDASGARRDTERQTERTESDWSWLATQVLVRVDAQNCPKLGSFRMRKSLL